MKNTLLTIVIITCLIVITTGCSRETATYDELESAGKTEGSARDEYSDFFKAVSRYGSREVDANEAVSDSTLINKAMEMTDLVIKDVRDFPTTVQSRIALDALSYAAYDLTTMPGYSHEDTQIFRRAGLINPIFYKGNEFIKSGNYNESTHLQLVKALKRSIASKATDEDLLNMIPVIGPAPSQAILEICKNDSLAFKKVYDLIIYTRSLQKIGPPLWMITGDWFLAVVVEGHPITFFSLKPLIIDELMYLAFRDYSQGEVYAAVFDDPVPTDTALMDSWLYRASGLMGSLEVDNSFADRVVDCGLPTYDAHNFYNDYILYADADSAKSEFYISIKRDRMDQNAFQFTGIDSIEVVFSKKEIQEPSEKITTLGATRIRGASMYGGNYTPERKETGTAYLMPLGVHDESILRKIREDRMPKIEVNQSNPE
ncbi:hypothetical protein ES708_20520 [subsurface metagenome]